MPDLPFKDEEYFDYADDSIQELNPAEMEKINQYAAGKTNEFPLDSSNSNIGTPGVTGGGTSASRSLRAQIANANMNYPGKPSVKMTKPQLRDLIVQEIRRMLKKDDEDEEPIDEVSTCAGVAGFQAPLGSQAHGEGEPDTEKVTGWKKIDLDDIQEPSMRHSFGMSLPYNTKDKNVQEGKILTRAVLAAIVMDESQKINESEVGAILKPIISLGMATLGLKFLGSLKNFIIDALKSVIDVFANWDPDLKLPTLKLENAVEDVEKELDAFLNELLNVIDLQVQSYILAEKAGDNTLSTKIARMLGDFCKTIGEQFIDIAAKIADKKYESAGDQIQNLKPYEVTGVEEDIPDQLRTVEEIENALKQFSLGDTVSLDVGKDKIQQVKIAAFPGTDNIESIETQYAKNPQIMHMNFYDGVDPEPVRRAFLRNRKLAMKLVEKATTPEGEPTRVDAMGERKMASISDVEDALREFDAGDLVKLSDDKGNTKQFRIAVMPGQGDGKNRVKPIKTQLKTNKNPSQLYMLFANPQNEKQLMAKAFLKNQKFLMSHAEEKTKKEARRIQGTILAESITSQFADFKNKLSDPAPKPGTKQIKDMKDLELAVQKATDEFEPKIKSFIDKVVIAIRVAAVKLAGKKDDDAIVDDKKIYDDFIAKTANELTEGGKTIQSIPSLLPKLRVIADKDHNKESENFIRAIETALRDTKTKDNKLKELSNDQKQIINKSIKPERNDLAKLIELFKDNNIALTKEQITAIESADIFRET